MLNWVANPLCWLVSLLDNLEVLVSPMYLVSRVDWVHGGLTLKILTVCLPPSDWQWSSLRSGLSFT